MKRIRLILQYDGTDYCGWQRQPAVPTVQAIIEEKLTFLLREKVVVTGAGRTDAGVHARRQFCHLETASPFAVGQLRAALNAHLPPAIRILDAREAAADWHARYDARQRTYRYHMAVSEERNPFLGRYTWHHRQPLDVAAMASAAAHWLGDHDFAALSSPDPDQNTVRTISTSRVVQSGGIIVYEVTSQAFLRHMVRRLIGLLEGVGRGAWSSETALAVLRGEKSRAAEQTAPPQGLFLWDISYPGLETSGVTDGMEFLDALCAKQLP